MPVDFRLKAQYSFGEEDAFIYFSLFWLKSTVKKRFSSYVMNLLFLSTGPCPTLPSKPMFSLLLQG